MSGGVDSSVAAALLKEQGYHCTGAYMKNWSGDDYGLQPDCPWEEDLGDMKAVCTKLGIPFRSFNFEKEYRSKVVEYFFEEYKNGRTPNPDIMCNKEIKFHLFLQKAIEEGADFIATGHYARKGEKNSTYQLMKGIDLDKDQSYFLYNLTQHQLSKTLFPIGSFRKKAIRDLAKKYDLPVAGKPDSQGICFIGRINVQDFLRSQINIHIGPILDIDTGELIGKHDGIEFYTIGQREGLKIGGASKPYFVARKDKQSNTLYAAMGSDHPSLYSKALSLQNIYLIDPSMQLEELLGKRLQAAIRYRQKPQSVVLSKEQNHIRATFEQPQRAVTEGQSMVLYDSEICLGGGIIEN